MENFDDMVENIVECHLRFLRFQFGFSSIVHYVVWIHIVNIFLTVLLGDSVNQLGTYCTQIFSVLVNMFHETSKSVFIKM